MTRKIDVRTDSRNSLVDITGRIEDAVGESKVEAGLCLIFVPHTTAGVTINENADPSVRRDLLMALARAVPDALPFTHAEGNSPAHVKASLVGSSACVVIEDGRLRLGTWQGIFLCEFDGPRQRHVLVKIISG
jgi:secondary thiamine-phosphate synthase enzyme